MKYFSNFKTLNYEFDSSIQTLVNIFNRPTISYDIEPSAYKSLEIFIEDGMSPDRVSSIYYQTHDYFWFILLQNKIYDFYSEWPVSYQQWKDDILLTYPEETFYTEFYEIAEQVQPGDLIVKSVVYSGDQYILDYNNYGVVIDSDSFLRSIDIKILSGTISENTKFTIVRKIDNEFYRVLPTEIEKITDLRYIDVVYTLRRKESKSNSISEFYTYSPLNGTKVYISPYSKNSNPTAGIISPKEKDLKLFEDTILYKYITRDLSGSVFVETFIESKEKEWLFSKRINLINPRFLTTVNKEYYNFVELDE